MPSIPKRQKGKTMQTIDTTIAPVRTLHTPYHELAALRREQSPQAPEWAQHRSVYRAGGRTLYLVETDRLDAARHDLDTLAGRGWEVRIDRDGAAANITLSRKAA
jgi:hypothetical protein